MAAYGIPAADIARVISVDPKTLRKCYRDELDLGETKANAQVAGFLFSAAKGGNVTAQIFWLKTRARWHEVPTELRHSGSIKNLDQRTEAELMKSIMSLAASAGLAPIKTIEAVARETESLTEPAHDAADGAALRLVGSDG